MNSKFENKTSNGWKTELGQDGIDYGTVTKDYGNGYTGTVATFENDDGSGFNFLTFDITETKTGKCVYYEKSRKFNSFEEAKIASDEYVSFKLSNSEIE